MYIKFHLSKVGRVETSTVTKPKSIGKLEFFYEQLDCRLVEVVPLNDSMILICDEEGLLTSQNPVFNIFNFNGQENIQIAGSFIIAKEGKDFEITSLNSSDAKDVLDNISVSQFGITK